METMNDISFYEKMQREFKDPEIGYRGVTLWMLNDKLEKQEAIRQLESFYHAGWGAVITRTFMGLRTRYLSEEWMSITEEVIKKAKELGMKVWLQEADKNAAGYMPTGIPGMEEEFRNLIIIRKHKNAQIDSSERVLSIYGDYVFCEKKVIPPGDWKNLLCVLDLLNPETVTTYLEKAYKPLLRFKDEFGHTVEAIWVDEPLIKVAQGITPALPWTKDFPTLFKERWGYSILEHIRSLFSEEGEFIKIRHHYWRLLTDIFKESYFHQVYDWCEKNNVRFSGHLMGEDTFFRQITSSGACMSYYEFMGIPGIDFLTADLTWPGGDPFLLPPKQCSAVAHQLSKKEILCEMYGVSSQGITFETRKQIADWLMVLGISYRCYHGSFYSMRGRRKRYYPPHLSYQQPYWRYNRLIADYFSRVSYMLRQGEYYADTLVIYPVESAQCIFVDGEETQQIRRLNESLVKLTNNLMDIKRSFDYGDESILEKYGRIEGNSIVVGNMYYRVIIMPSMITLRKSTFDLLTEFISNGGMVISVGDLPSRIDGELSEDIDILNRKVTIADNTRKALEGLLDSYLPEELDILSEDGARIRDIWVHHRRVEPGQLFYLVNVNKTDTYEVVLKVPGKGRLEMWRLEDGEIEVLPQFQDKEYLLTRLVFYPGSSYMLFLNENELPMNLPEERLEIKQTVSLKNSYKVKRHDPNSITLDFCRYKKGDGDWSKTLPVIGIQELLSDERYNGPVSLQFEFFCKDKPGSIFLVIEDPERYDIDVNGREVTYSGLPYYRDISFSPIDITEDVNEGRNIIEISTYFKAGDPTSQRDLEKLYGTELESIYLIGDFAVKGNEKRKDDKLIWYYYGFNLSGEEEETDGDLISSGYPFYNGAISLTQNVSLPMLEEKDKIFLEIDTLNTVLARVKINNIEAGNIGWKPYRIEITDLVRSGINTVELELINSLRNLLGPHHNPLSEEVSTWNYSFSGRSKDGVEWLKKRDEGNCISWTDDYSFIPLGIKDVKLVIYSRCSGKGEER